VGGTLYMTFIASWLWALYRAVSFSSLIAIAGPPMLYGVAHNGTRFSILYAMMALSLALCEERGLSVHRMGPDAVRRRMRRSNLVPSGLARLEGREYLGARKR